jgi:hypothetical protein
MTPSESEQALGPELEPGPGRALGPELALEPELEPE